MLKFFERNLATRFLVALWAPVPDDARAAEPPPHSRRVWLALSVAAASLMYFSVTQFPYLRSDDTFLIRTNWFLTSYTAIKEVNFLFVHVMLAKLLDQGRFFFWLSINGTAYLYEQYGLEPLAYVRAVGVGILGLVGYLLMRHLHSWGYSRVTAVCVMALILALPGFQIILGNGVWLMLGAWWAMLAVNLIMRVDAWPRRRLAGYAAVRLVLIASLAVYQSLTFVFAAVAAAALASPEWEKRQGVVTNYVIRSLTIMAIATLVYYFAWILLVKYVVEGPSTAVGNGYAPQMLFHELGANWTLFVERRVPQILNLWYAPHISRPLASWVGWSFVALWTARVALARGRWRDEALKVLLYVVLFAAAESCLIVADRYNYFASKFTTSVAQSVVLIFLLIDTARWLRSVAARYVRVDHTAYPAALMALTIVCCVKAQMQTWSLIVMPSSLETRFVGTHITEFLKTHGRIDEIEIIGLNRALMSEQTVTDAYHPEKVGEFMFGNYGSVGYMHYLARNVMLDITGEEPTRVIAKQGDTVSDFIYPGRTLAPDSANYRVVIDTREMSVYWRP